MHPGGIVFSVCTWFDSLIPFVVNTTRDWYASMQYKNASLDQLKVRAQPIPL